MRSSVTSDLSGPSQELVPLNDVDVASQDPSPELDVSSETMGRGSGRITSRSRVNGTRPPRRVTSQLRFLV